MKLTGILILAAMLQVSARSAAQTVTYEAKAAPLTQVFAAIKQQTGYVFFYDIQDLQGTVPVTVKLQNSSLRDALETILTGEPLSFDIQGNTIVISRKPMEIVATQLGQALPPGDVHGRVTDSLGKPLAGVNILIKGTRRGTATNENGEFQLSGTPSNAVLVISMVGYETQEIKLNGKTDVPVQLKVGITSLNDVVVNKGYYTVKQRENTGNVTTVKGEEIEKQPVSNPLAALEGRVPGLVVTQTTGAPGGGFKVQIRGQNSLFNGNDPFYVVDGIPYPSQTLGLINGVLKTGSPLNYINPADIESIEVLKDADATSIYGSRAAHGAILITTKKGKAGAMKVDINLYSGFEKETRQVNLLNTSQYLQMRHEAFYNDSIASGNRPSISNAPDLLLWDTTRYTNWQKVLAGNTAHYSDAQVSVSGGSANTQYLIGGGYHKQTTVFPVVLPGQGADQKVSLHFNTLNTSDNKKFKLNLTGTFVSDLNTVQPNDFSSNAFILPPDAPSIYKPDGSLNWAPVVSGRRGTWSNPFAQLYRKYKGLTSNLISDALISYNLLPGLNLRASMGYTNTQTNEIATIPTTAMDPGQNVASGFSTFNSTNSNSWIIEPQADYKLNVGKGTLSVLVGWTFHQNNMDLKTNDASGFISDALLEDLSSASSVRTTSNSAQYKYTAAFGRVNYNWADKYILNLTARRDGSSRFGPSRQFANFGAIGAAWIFTEENFIKRHISFLSFGKIRSSYGTSGNDQIGDYRFLDLYSPIYNNPYQGIQGLYVNNLFNPILAWELDKKLEVGLELGILKDRLIVNASYFRNRSGNQLVRTPISFVTGFSYISANLPALIQNSGFELVLNTVNIQSKTFNWKSSLNLSIPRNKLISYPNLQNSPFVNTLVVGQSINAIKVYHFIGVNDTTGIYQFGTAKGDLSYNPTYNIDNTILVNMAPQFYGGLINSFQWKGFSLDFLFQFTKQTGANLFRYYSPMPGSRNNQLVDVLNRWQKPGDIKPFEQFSQNYGSNAYQGLSNLQNSDFVYSDASFIRLKNLSFSYALPVNQVKRWHLQNVRIYVQGQNLLTITKYTGIDPETQSLVLPPLKVWTAGIQITL